MLAAFTAGEIILIATGIIAAIGTQAVLIIQALRNGHKITDVSDKADIAATNAKEAVVKTEEIHDLVNSTHSEGIARIDQLTQSMQSQGANIPARPVSSQQEEGK